MPLRQQVLRYIREQDLLAGAKHILCAFSGGADSVCLLHILYSLREELGVQLCAAHYNHLLRGDESQRDQDFAAEFCRKLEIPLLIGSGDVAARAASCRQGLEETGRDMRYGFLEECADRFEDCRIATAHQAEDQVETVLLHLIRGCSLAGLSGIPPRRGRIIRPLLFASRKEILAYLEEWGLEHVEDSSNASADFARNCIRQEVLPVLERLNPSYTRGVRQMTELVREDEKYLLSQAHTLIEQTESGPAIPLAALKEASSSAASRAVLLCAGQFGLRPEKKHVDGVLKLALEKGSGSMDLPDGLRCTVKQGSVLFSDQPERVSPGFPETPLVWNAWMDIPETKYSVFWGEAEKAAKINGQFTTFFFKKAKICGNIHVRPRKSGDQIRLQERMITKSLKRLMNEMKIPPARRQQIPIVADQAGILAVPGAGTDVRAWSAADTADAVLLISERNGTDELQYRETDHQRSDR